MSRFCAKCGAPINERAAFCAKCGSRVEEHTAPTSPPPTSAPSPPNVGVAPPSLAVPAAPAPAQAAKSGSAFLKVLIATFAFFALVTVLGIGSCLYVGYRVKKKVNQIQQAYQHNDVAGIVAAVTGKGGNQAPQTLPQWKPAPADLVSSPAAKIPLRVGLRWVDAGTETLRGDFESIFVVDSVTDKEVHVKGSEEFPNLPSLPGTGGAKVQLAKKINCGRTVLRRDLENSAEDHGYFCFQGHEDKFPGTTAFGFSTETFNDLRTSGQAPFTYHEDPMKALFKSFKNAASGSGDASEFLNRVMGMAPGATEPPPTPPIPCTLERVGAGDAAFPVMVNDKRVELPAMHVVCKASDPDEDLLAYVLDDADNPLWLAAQQKSEGIFQVIRIYWTTESASPASQLEQQLQQQGRAKIYGIYFDFASDTLRPESQPVLKEIVQVMRDNPGWKLSIEGHTDNIGGDAYNLDLSRRRAAAVKRALVTQYRIDAERFSTAGFGASRPVATNDTLEGRALNRRVELVRQ